MNTGIVVNNFDPKHKNRCQIRVNGIHTEKVDGDYVILDDDLPWATPSESLNSPNGTSAVPNVGDRVYVEKKDKYNYVYYGQVEVKHQIKKLQNDNIECSEKVKVIAFSEDGEDEYLKIYYIPKSGLKIGCNGHLIDMTSNNGMTIKTNTGVSIEMTSNNDVNINTTGTVNLNCKNVNLTESPDYRALLGEKIMEKFNSHTHIWAGLGGITTTSQVKITEDDLSRNVKLK